MDKSFNKITSLDLCNDYYMKRQVPVGQVASLPNIEICVMRVSKVPIGSSVQLPDHIKSIVIKALISQEDFDEIQTMWKEKAFVTFCDWVRFYNNADVIGLSEELTKMFEHEKNVNKLD